MPEHVHLLISEPQRQMVADAIKSLTQGVARRLIGNGEHFWQKRYYDLNVRNHRQFMHKLRYVHRNPVKRGLCARPEDWQWSSYRQYATGCEGRVQIESEWIATKRERAAGRLGPAKELPHSSQKKLEWATQPAASRLLAHVALRNEHGKRGRRCSRDVRGIPLEEDGGQQAVRTQLIDGGLRTKP